MGLVVDVYMRVAVVAIHSKIVHIVVTTKDKTSDIARKGNARTSMRSVVAENMLTSDDIVNVQFLIVRFGALGP